MIWNKGKQANLYYILLYLRTSQSNSHVLQGLPAQLPIVVLQWIRCSILTFITEYTLITLYNWGLLQNVRKVRFSFFLEIECEKYTNEWSNCCHWHVAVEQYCQSFPPHRQWEVNQVIQWERRKRHTCWEIKSSYTENKWDERREDRQTPLASVMLYLFFYFFKQSAIRNQQDAERRVDAI